MTIIVSYACYPFVVQVSDRRLTYTDGRLADDNTTKSILWNQNWLLSYTGLAKIQGKPTHQWLAELLAESHAWMRQGYLDRNLALLGQRMGQIISRERVPRQHRRLAVAGAGWAVPWDVGEPPPAGLRPWLWHRSNCLDEDGEPVATRETFEFHIGKGRPLTKTEMLVQTYGQELPPDDWKRMCRRLKQARPDSPARRFQLG